MSDIKISVRELVEFVLRRGSIDNRFVSNATALDGIKGHQFIQKSYGENYEAEVTLKHELEYKGIKIIVSGRIDGVIIEEKGITIDEIKTTSRDLDKITEDYSPVHWAQAKCYAYIYSLQNNKETIDIQLTYYNIDTKEIKKFVNNFKFKELDSFFYEIIKLYYKWIMYAKGWSKMRDETIKELSFPHNNYRNGQRQLAVAVYKTIVQKKKLFAEAVTGIGKTIGVLFPAIKAIGEGQLSKIFYLTAKTSTKKVAEDTVNRLLVQGLKLKYTTLTAKDKICFKEEANCNPEYCEYAKGHYDRVNEAIYEILKNEDGFTKETIERYAKSYNLCPFEFSLDLTLFSDCIICDYNYVFDPRASLKRYFEENRGEKYTFLIDESHNLVDRAMDMYSAELYKSPILKLKKEMKVKCEKISRALEKLNKFMIEMRKLCKEESYVSKQIPEQLTAIVRKNINEMEKYLLEENDNEELLQLYFDLSNFAKVIELYDERYVTYVENENGDTKIKLYCIDPSYLIGENLKKADATIFFSATLMPLEYFFKMYCGAKDDYVIKLASPFDLQNRSILIADTISTKFKNRENSYENICTYILALVEAKTGNYIVFFPSYKYMKDVYEKFLERNTDIKVIIQRNDMTEEEKEDFLNNFNEKPRKTTLGFCVVGGMYSEGVDLKKDRLIGVIVVGVGLPQICLERNLIKEYFSEENGLGYEYAYMYPGMIKVLQAVGRLIRTESDKGIILLIDERYSYGAYKKIFPKEWYPNSVVRNEKIISNRVIEFWNKHLVSKD